MPEWGLILLGWGGEAERRLSCDVLGVTNGINDAWMGCAGESCFISTSFRSRGWYSVIQEGINVVDTSFLIHGIWQQLGFVFCYWTTILGVSVPDDRGCEIMEDTGQRF